MALRQALPPVSVMRSNSRPPDRGGVAAFRSLPRRRGATRGLDGHAHVAPWMLRAFWLTGNPIAPLGNRIFSNPYFHEGTEQYLASYLKDYGVSGWRAIPHALLFDGAALQGLLGPVWILALLGLWLLREPAGRWLWAAAVVSALPWLANAGSRFLLPALLFAGSRWLPCCRVGRLSPSSRCMPSCPGPR